MIPQQNAFQKQAHTHTHTRRRIRGFGGFWGVQKTFTLTRETARSQLFVTRTSGNLRSARALSVLGGSRCPRQPIHLIMTPCLLVVSCALFPPPVLRHATYSAVAAPRCAAHPVVMAGFGGSSKSSKGGGRKTKAVKAKPAGVTAKQQWDLFRDLRSSDQVLTAGVYARLPDEGAEWLDVGAVIVEAPGTRAQAAMLNKRLILEHAARLYPKLAVRSRELVCGHDVTNASGDAVVVPLEKCEVPPGTRGGFQGLPDASSGMYVIVDAPRR